MSILVQALAYWLCVIGFSVSGSILALYLYDQLGKPKRQRETCAEMLANAIVGMMLVTVFLGLSLYIRR